MARLTDLSIRSLKPPDSGQKTYLDDSIKGFGVRVSQGGTKTFVVTYGTDRRRETLGQWPILSLAKAREVAQRLLAERTMGIVDPVPYDELKTLFLADCKARLRAKTCQDYEGLLRRVKLPQNLLHATPTTIANAVKDFTPSVRFHAIAVSKILFKFGVNGGYLKINPAVTLTVRKSKARKRVLTDEELIQVWRAAPDTAYGTTVKLLALTGARRNEVQHIVLTGDLAFIDGQHTKNHRDHTFPVTGHTIELLGQDRAWSGWSKSKKDLDLAIHNHIAGADKMVPWTLHDLRRTFRTKWARLRLPRELGERYINHVSGVQSPIELVYDQHDYLEELRECIKVYTDHIAKLMAA